MSHASTVSYPDPDPPLSARPDPQPEPPLHPICATLRWRIEAVGVDHDLLLGRAAVAIPPKDAIDWILLNEALYFTWDIRAHERGRSTFPDSDYAATIETFLREDLEEPLPLPAARDLVLQYLAGDAKAAARLECLLAGAGLSLLMMHAKEPSYAIRKRLLEELNARNLARCAAALNDLAGRRDVSPEDMASPLDRIVDAAAEEISELLPSDEIEDDFIHVTEPDTANVVSREAVEATPATPPTIGEIEE